MSCVAVIKVDGKITMGGDQVFFRSETGESMTKGTPSVFKIAQDRVLVGVEHSPRLAQIIQYGMSLPKDVYDSPMQYMVNVFIPFLQHAINEVKYDMPDRRMGGIALVGYRGSVFIIDPEFSVRQLDPTSDFLYAAIGPARHVMHGAIFAQIVTGKRDPHDILRVGFAAAESHNLFTRGEITYVTL